jgi:hypothetical protein
MAKRNPRALMLAVILALAALAPLPVLAEGESEPTAFTPESIVFPVIGEVTYTDTFGAPRSEGRTHEGVDLMSVGAVKGLPVVAAADGVVKWIGDECCYLALDHGGGWETWYIHLDNDTPGTDDGLGWGIAEGIQEGTPVAQGQVIGFLGDSGNAEEAGAHLHFEIRQDSVALNPYPYVLTAPVLGDASPPAGPRANPWEGQFKDDDDSVHQDNIEILFAEGITKGCNPPTNDLYCPLDELTRGQVAAFLRRHLVLPAAETDYFTDDGSSVFEDDINALTAAGIGFGCSETRFCADTPLTRAEMAEYLVRTFGFDNPEQVDFFTDDDSSPYQDAINAVAADGITVGCSLNRPVYCPESSLTRQEMATFLARSLELGT